jgi:hypothetical protein
VRPARASRRLRAYRQIANAATPDARERVEKSSRIATVRRRTRATRLVNLVSRTRGAQFTPAGVLILQLQL